MGAGGSIPDDTPLGWILGYWVTYVYPPMKKGKGYFTAILLGLVLKYPLAWGEVEISV